MRLVALLLGLLGTLALGHITSAQPFYPSYQTGNGQIPAVVAACPDPGGSQGLVESCASNLISIAYTNYQTGNGQIPAVALLCPTSSTGQTVGFCNFGGGGSGSSVTPYWGTTPVALSTAVFGGTIRVDEQSVAYYGNAKSATCKVTAVTSTQVTLSNCAGNTPNFSSANTGETIAIDQVGLTPSVGGIASMPVATPGNYPEGSASIAIAFGNVGAGEGVKWFPVWAVQSVTLVGGGAGCPGSGTETFIVAGGGSIPTYVSATVTGGVVSGPSIIANPHSSTFTTGYFRRNLPAAGTVFPLNEQNVSGPNCQTSPTVLLTFGLDHIVVFQPGRQYPVSGVTMTLTNTGAVAPTTSATLGTVTVSTPVQPLQTTIASGSSGTTLNLTSGLLTTPPNRQVMIDYCNDDAPAINAAIAQQYAAWQAGVRVPVELPAGYTTCLVTQTSVMQYAGGVQGTAMGFKSPVIIMPNYPDGAAAFDCHNNTRLVNSAFGTNVSTSFTDAVTPCVFQNLSIIDWQSAYNVHHGLEVSGRSDFSRVQNVDMYFIHGSGLRLGYEEAGDTQSWWNEAFVDHVRCRWCGTVTDATYPVMDTTTQGTGSGDGSNTDYINDISLWNPQAPCISLHNEATAAGKQRMIHIHDIRCESGIQDFIDVGTVDGITNEVNTTANEGILNFDDLHLVGTSQDWSAITCLSTPNPNFGQTPSQIQFGDIYTSGMFYGNLADMEGCSFTKVSMAGSNPSTVSFDMVVGPAGTGNVTANREISFILDRSQFQASAYQWSIDASEQNEVSIEGCYGDPEVWSSGYCYRQGTMVTSGLQLTSLTGSVYCNGTSSACGALPTTPVTGIVTAGAGPFSGTHLTSMDNEVDTCASGGVTLPQPSVVPLGYQVVVRDRCGGNFTVWPDSSSDNIEGGSAGVGVTATNGNDFFFTHNTTSGWRQ